MREQDVSFKHLRNSTLYWPLQKLSFNWIIGISLFNNNWNNRVQNRKCKFKKKLQSFWLYPLYSLHQRETTCLQTVVVPRILNRRCNLYISQWENRVSLIYSKNGNHQGGVRYLESIFFDFWPRIQKGRINLIVLNRVFMSIRMHSYQMKLCQTRGRALTLIRTGNHWLML